MKKIIMLLVMLSGLLLSNDEVKAKPHLGISFLLNPSGTNDVTINLNSSEFNNLTIKELGDIISKYNNVPNIVLINLEIGNVKFSNTSKEFVNNIDNKIKESFSQNDNKDTGFFNSNFLKNIKDENERVEIVKDLIIYSLLLIISGALGMVLFIKISEEISGKMKNEGHSIYYYLLKYGLRFILLCIVVYFIFICINGISTYLAK